MSEQEQEHLKDLERIKNLRLLDDEFMNKVFEKNYDALQLVLRIIMNDNAITVQEGMAKTQYLIKNLQGKDIWLDIHAIDNRATEYDLEIQRADYGAGARRARYNLSLMDANQKDAGQFGNKLPETYVIFITEHDVLGRGKPLYRIEKYIDGEMIFNDGSHIIYVNGAYVDDESAIGKLMHDFRCKQAKDMYYQELAEKVRHFKETEEGVTSMCKELEIMRNEAAAKAAFDNTVKNIKNLMKNANWSASQAMKALGIAEGDYAKFSAAL